MEESKVTEERLAFLENRVKKKDDNKCVQGDLNHFLKLKFVHPQRSQEYFIKKGNPVETLMNNFKRDLGLEDNSLKYYLQGKLVLSSDTTDDLDIADDDTIDVLDISSKPSFSMRHFYGLGITPLTLRRKLKRLEERKKRK